MIYGVITHRYVYELFFSKIIAIGSTSTMSGGLGAKIAAIGSQYAISRKTLMSLLPFLIMQILSMALTKMAFVSEFALILCQITASREMPGLSSANESHGGTGGGRGGGGGRNLRYAIRIAAMIISPGGVLFLLEHCIFPI